MFEKFDAKIDRSLQRDEIDKNSEIILKNSTKKRIQENDFRDIFGAEDVAADKKLVARLEEKFHEQIEHLSPQERENIKYGEKLGRVLEIIIAEEGEKYGWFGPDALTQPTSRYDDTVNNADLIVEFGSSFPPTKNEAPRRVALSVDASRNQDFTVISQKFQRNIDKLTHQNGKTTPEIKYYESPLNPNIKGPLEIVIPLVVGLEEKNANELINLVAPLKTLPQTAIKYPALRENAELKIKQLEERLADHPAQAVFYRQMRTQLNYYLKILNRQPNEQSKDYIREIQSILIELTNIRQQKKPVTIGNYSKDKVLTAIEGLTFTA